MHANYSGRCQVTGRSYQAGTAIRRTGDGWAIDDDTTTRALAEAPTATVWFSDGPASTMQGPWETGDLVRYGDRVVVVVTARYGYDVEDECRCWFASAREATPEEAAPLLAVEAEEADRAAVYLARRDAEREFSMLPRTEAALPDCKPVRVYTLQQAKYMGHEYDPDCWRVYEYADGSVYADLYMPSLIDSTTYWMTDPEEAVRVATAAAWTIHENGQVMVDHNPATWY